ncbi:rhodanese-like domain-containing protein [Streptomyces sp. NPDC002838]|uniref:rhodanese-like domain-containing protein n=1 Tax=Streptomyces sp. NPDC002838 TaxID=3154436 RepID=UPI00332045C8
MNTPITLSARQAHSRIHELTVIDVRTPGEYAAGHLPGALNIPLDQLRRALPDIRRAAERRDILVVCASGARSRNACSALAEHGISAATLTGGTSAWAAEGHEVHHPGNAGRVTWAMDRQVRFTAGLIILLGLLLGLIVHPAFQVLSAGVAAGLLFSAMTNTCAMATVLSKLPHNRPRATDLNAALARLRDR